MRIQEFDNFQTDLLQSILWQYDQATNLLSLMNQKQGWYNVNFTQFWDDWYNNIFNLASPTLSLFGATVWSIILNVPLFVPVVPPPDPTTFPVYGFNEYDPTFPTLLNNNQNFENGNFYPYRSDIVLTLPQQQFLLRLRYFQLTNLGDVVTINKFLLYLCTDNLIDYSGNIYILDNLGMSITYDFTATDFPVSLADAIQTLDILPRPAGVAITYTGI
jgi:hypothetical protein